MIDIITIDGKHLAQYLPQSSSLIDSWCFRKFSVFETRKLERLVILDHGGIICNVEGVLLVWTFSVLWSRSRGICFHQHMLCLSLKKSISSAPSLKAYRPEQHLVSYLVLVSWNLNGVRVVRHPKVGSTELLHVVTLGAAALERAENCVRGTPAAGGTSTGGSWWGRAEGVLTWTASYRERREKQPQARTCWEEGVYYREREGETQESSEKNHQCCESTSLNTFTAQFILSALPGTAGSVSHNEETFRGGL